MPGTRFGAWFDRQIAERDITLAQAAEVLETHPSTLSRWSNGLAWPGRKNLRLLAARWGVDRDELETMIEADRLPDRAAPIRELRPPYAEGDTRGKEMVVGVGELLQAFDNVLLDHLSPEAQAKFLELKAIIDREETAARDE